MHLVNLTTARLRRTALLIFAIFSYVFASAQENSPYSRYGLGDIVPAQNMVSRSMGGISAGFIDSIAGYPYIFTPYGPKVSSASINLANPASLGSNTMTIFDLGGEVDIKTLKSNNSPAKFRGTNTIISYLQLAFPITPKRMLSKGNSWTVAFGLRPITKVNYKVLTDKRLVGIDSISTLYEGNGGLNQANISTGLRFKNFSFGLSTGYNFGNRETSTKIAFNNDSVRYQMSNTQASARFGGIFLNLGMQYAVHLKNKKNSLLRFGATANLQQSLRARNDKINETFQYNSDGDVVAIDTVNFANDLKGKIKLPASYTAGFTYTDSNWVFGADINYTGWSQYSYFGAKDVVKNNTTFRIGAQYYPAKFNTPANKYWRFVRYRAGFFYGKDYVTLGGSDRPEYGITAGLGMPLTPLQFLRRGEFVMLNSGVEFGQRGNKSNLSIRENVMRFNIGIAMTATWFQKRKYD